MFKTYIKTCPVLLLVAMLGVTVAACQPRTAPRPTVMYAEVSPSPTIPSATPRPTYTPTPAPLGHSLNPVVMGFIAADASDTQNQAASALADYLGQTVNLQVESQFFASYKDLESALKDSRVHLVWLGPIETLITSQQALLDVTLVSNHLGVTAYGVQFLANQESGFVAYFDAAQNAATASLVTALAQFAGRRPCLTEESSLAAYWVPIGLLMQAGVTTQEPAITLSTSASIRALYITGICDFAATYALSGDPRTASGIITDLPDIIERVPIIWRSEGIIPNLSLSFSANLDLPYQSQIQEALLTYARTKEGLSVLTNANDYVIEALEITDGRLFDDLRSLLEIQEIDLYSLLENK